MRQPVSDHHLKERVFQQLIASPPTERIPAEGIVLLDGKLYRVTAEICGWTIEEILQFIG